MWSQIIQVCASVAKLLNTAVLAQVTAVFIECISIIVIVLGVVVACYRITVMLLRHNFSDVGLKDGWIHMRRAFSESMLLGLQFLVAADIILTIGHPDLKTVGVLAAVVLIRVVLSVTLAREISEMKHQAELEEGEKEPDRV